MARIVPSDLSRLALSGVHQPEIATLALLESKLPDDYTVFHGVHWTRQYKGNTLYGEIDFVVLNPAGRILCIEQKNGPLRETDEGLVKDYGAESKNVKSQIQRSVDRIREKFDYQCGGKPRLSVEYLIYCPDHAVKKLNAAALDAERIVDAPKRGELAAYIQAILPLAPPDASGHATRVRDFFCQTFEVVPDIHAHVDAQEKNFTRLSGGLVEVLDRIEMEPLRLRVLATAGNGKTLVANHFFDQALAAGKQPLLVCFNRPLAERLGHLSHAGGMVSTWYGFCDRFLQSRGIRLPFSTMREDPDFWPKAAQQVADRAMAGTLDREWSFDTLIVDEAQDFEPGWFEILRLFLKDGADVLWLEDPNQNLRCADPTLFHDRGFIGYRSLLNYRSPESIARFITQALPAFQFTCANDLPGLGVGVTSYTEPEQQPKLVGRIVGRLLNQCFHPRQISILSCRGMESTVFKELERVGNRTLARFTGEYDLFGNQVWTSGQIPFDTVRRFKGQQQAAVILTDVDPQEKRLTQELQVLFCGMTRATVRLDVVCNERNPWVAEHLTPVMG